MRWSAVGTTQGSRRGFCDGGLVQEYDEFSGGIAFMYPINQAILILDSNVSGKVLGPVQGDSYIVQLDQPTPVTKAVIVHEDNMRILDCHWCRDSQRVPETPFYIGQF